MSATPRRERRAAIMKRLVAMENIDAVVVDSLATEHHVKRGVIMKDLKVLTRRLQNSRTPKGQLVESLKALMRGAVAAEDYGPAIRAVEAIAKIEGHIAPQGQSVQVTTNATAQTSVQVNTFAELARKAAQEDEREARLKALEPGAN